ncbi:DUF5362 family protein [Streptomyces sp. NPDC102360]|uniref:DUF5362 family protein n=1 Tax=Streptomyces sp. NPDC102360 TaxID=3366160 RepID=UPI0037F41514
MSAPVHTWSPATEPRVVFDGFAGPTSPERIEQEMDRFTGSQIARGWTLVHQQGGAALLQSQTEKTNTGGSMAKAGGAAAGGVGILSMLGGVFLMLAGIVLCLTIIGAVLGVPLIMAALAMFGGGAAVGGAGTAVGAAGVASGGPSTLYRRVSVWADETGRLYAKDVA